MTREAGFAAAVWLLAVAGAPLGAQTIDDHLMMPKKQLCTGFGYMHDSFDRYWEGTLERDNANMGTLSTQSVSWMGTYGVTDRINVIAMAPWIKTEASAGTSSGLDDFQDLTVGIKWNALTTALTRHGDLQVFLVASGAVPLTDYTPDFMPFSIGSHSQRAAGRLSLNWQTKKGFFIQGTSSYTWRDNVTLNRDSYFTDGRLYFSNEVAMPDVIDYAFRVGWWKNDLYLPISFTQQITAGGGDIRRQDAPFVSNRMNFSRVDGFVKYYFTRPKNWVAQAGVSHTFSGRNVGKSTTLQAGLLYTFQF